MSNDLPPPEPTHAEFDQAALTRATRSAVTRRIFAFGAGLLGVLALSASRIALAKTKVVKGKDLFPKLPGEKKGHQPKIHKPSKPLPIHKPSKPVSKHHK